MNEHSDNPSHREVSPPSETSAEQVNKAISEAKGKGHARTAILAGLFLAFLLGFVVLLWSFPTFTEYHLFPPSP